MNEFELSEEQLLMLQHICNKRYKMLSGVFMALPAFLSYALLNAYTNDEIRNTIVNWTNIIIILIILSALSYLYLYKISPIKKDIAQKKGKYDNKVIVNKTEFPHVNQYYIFFEDDKLPSKEITQAEFFSFNIGDIYPVPLGKNSNLVLDGFMNYNLF